MINLFLLIYLLLFPLNIKLSGVASLSSYVTLVFIFSTFLYDYHKNKLTRKIQNDLPLYIAMILACLINLYYFLTYKRDFSFIQSSMYLVFACLITYSYSSRISNRFIHRIKPVLYLGVIWQMLLTVSKRNNVLIESFNANAIRNMGSFNDPNQLAFYIFVIIVFLYATMRTKKDIYCFLFILIPAFYLIYTSKSVNALLGVSIILYGALLKWIKDKMKISYGVTILSTILIGVIILILFTPNKDFDYINAPYTLTNRIIRKLYEINYGDGLYSIVKDRAWVKAFAFPKYLLYGAGEGMNIRFAEVQILEIHNSILNYLFCYGIIPTSILMVWIYQKFTNLTDRGKICASALFIESMFLVNYKMIIFWILLVTIYMTNKKIKCETIQIKEKNKMENTQKYLQENDYLEKESDDLIKKIVHFVYLKKLIVIVSLLVGLVFGVVYGKVTNRITYQNGFSVLVDVSNIKNIKNLNSTAEIINTYSSLIQSSTVVNNALKGSEYENKHVSVTAVPRSGTFIIDVTVNDADDKTTNEVTKLLAQNINHEISSITPDISSVVINEPSSTNSQLTSSLKKAAVMGFGVGTILSIILLLISYNRAKKKD